MRTTELARSFVGVALAAIAALGSCSGEVGVVGTGESHFLRGCDASCAQGYACVCGVCSQLCSKTTECAGFSDAARCVSAETGSCAEQPTKMCDVQCGSRTDCAPLGNDFDCVEGACRAAAEANQAADGGKEQASNRCETGCVEITGYPEDGSNSCTDLRAAESLGCACHGDSPDATCMHRHTDDTYWLVVGGVPSPSSDWSDCALEQRGPPFSHSCDFADCGVAPASFCSTQETCSSVGCGTGELDEQGCVNPRCTTDADCAETERCVTAPINTELGCAPKVAGGCECGAFKEPTYDQFCNPVSAVGPRGAWQTLTTVAGIGSCTATDTCATRTLTPDGKVVGSDGSSFALDDLALQRVVRIVDGPDFRVEMAEGFECDGPPPGAMAWIRFEMAGDELEQAVTGCIATGPAGNDAETIFDLLAEP
jgi:hypothetical protein